MAEVLVDDDGVVTLRGVARGVTAVTVTTVDQRDGRVAKTFAVTVGGPALVALVPQASDPVREGFVRVINHSALAGEMTVEAVDDTGRRVGPVTLAVPANATVHFNSKDLEAGNPSKGFPDGVGAGQGDWRLVLDSDLDFEVLSYIRTVDGFLAAMHDTVPARDGLFHVATFKPRCQRGPGESLAARESNRRGGWRGDHGRRRRGRVAWDGSCARGASGFGRDTDGIGTGVGYRG